MRNPVRREIWVQEKPVTTWFDAWDFSNSLEKKKMLAAVPLINP